MEAKPKVEFVTGRTNHDLVRIRFKLRNSGNNIEVVAWFPDGGCRSIAVISPDGTISRPQCAIPGDLIELFPGCDSKNYRFADAT